MGGDAALLSDIVNGRDGVTTNDRKDPRYPAQTEIQTNQNKKLVLLLWLLFTDKVIDCSLCKRGARAYQGTAVDICC